MLKCLLVLIRLHFIKILLNKIKQFMSQNNSSLIGFLKKKSLFPASPEKSIKNKQLSRDLKKTGDNKKATSNNPQLAIQQSYTKSTKDLYKNAQDFDFLPAAEADSYLYNGNEIQNTIRYQASTPQLLKTQYSQRNFNPAPNKQEVRFVKPLGDEKNIWSGIVTKVATFQSARIQSIQCLENLGFKIQSEISSISFRIDAFQSKMCRILDEQFEVLKQKISKMIEKMFQENDKNIKLYIKQQQRALAADLLIMRDTLLKQHQKILTMRQQINKPNWKKVAGELLSQDVQQKIERMLLKSKSLAIKRWELKDMGISKLPGLEKELKNVIEIGLNETY